MSRLDLSDLLLREGHLTSEQLERVRASSSSDTSFEDALRASGLVEPDVLARLLTQVDTPLPSTPPPSPRDRDATLWELEAPQLDETPPPSGDPSRRTTQFEAAAADPRFVDGPKTTMFESIASETQYEDGVSVDAPTGRFPGAAAVGFETREELMPTNAPTGRTTRWEVPVPLPGDDPTGMWALGESDDADLSSTDLSSTDLSSTAVDESLADEVEAADLEAADARTMDTTLVDVVEPKRRGGGQDPDDTSIDDESAEEDGFMTRIEAPSE